ncbi:MAG: site-specific integrase [Gammaproteobacteria bacterium]|nr:site-specific integrase [Gammaproteobacteria bacterium]
MRGFMLRINPGGSKSWYVQLDRSHKRKIGDARRLSATRARYRARDLLERAESLKSVTKGPGTPSLREFLTGRYTRWLERKSRYGRRDARRLLSALGGLVDERLDHIGRRQVERWKLQRAARVRPATVHREIAALRAALNCAVRWKLIATNPAQGVKIRLPATDGAPRILQADERARLLACLDQREDSLAVLVTLALQTGLSRGELFRLRWKDVSFGVHASVEVSHSRRFRNRNRKIPLNALAERRLSRWRSTRRHRSTLVFPSPSGGPLTSVQTAWNRLMKEARIRGFRLCDCRHDFAARLVSAGVPTARVSELLGHSSQSLADRYASFAVADTREAVARLMAP